MLSVPVRMLIAIGFIVCLAAPHAGAGQAVPPVVQPADGVTTLLRSLQQVAAAGDRAGILALGDPQISRPSFEDFAATLTAPPPTRVVVTERDRAPRDAGMLRLVVEIFTERGIEGRLGTWRVDVRPGDSAADPWRIALVGRLSVVTGLYRLSLDTATEYDITNLVVRAPDLTIDMPSGRAFVASTPDGPTAMVLLGRGRMTFSPPDRAERTQIRILSGRDELVEQIDMAFLRFSPSQPFVDPDALKPRAVDPSDVRTAVAVFNDLAPRSLQVDLSDISRDRWSLTPALADVIAELRTKRFGTLTYARSNNEPEDINLFDRKRRRNISIYTSAAKLAQRGRFYSEDERLDYDVLAYDIDAQFTPDRSVIDGNARLKLRILENGTSSLTLKLAETVAIRGVYSPDFGRLLHLRVVGQNSIIVNLPEVLASGTELLLDVRYSGPVAPQAFDREAIQIGQGPPPQEQRIEIPLQPRYLYSNRSYWYPQATVTDYATATIRITVPTDYDAIATGQPVESPTPPPGGTDNQRRRKILVFETSRPVRYLAVIVSRFNRLDNARIPAGSSDVSLYIQSTPRAPVRIRETSERTASVLAFYASLLGDAPYPSFTLALAESDRPGGHSPPYFAVLNQLLPGSTIVWRNDPVNFENFPSFFLAHELAHQWWGQAVGWKNYHEQWLSEAFAQYFAVLYAEKEREGSLPGILRQMRRTAMDASSDGPVYLGYRLGHIQGDDRIFRAVVYNKGAMVLHMLRRLVGEDAFFGGMRAFYQQWKFKKAGTDDFRQIMERAAGRNLQRFFDAWIFGAEIPRIKLTTHVSATEATVRFEQLDELVDAPITVTITYQSGNVESVVVILTDKHTEQTIPLTGRVRTIAANADNAALVDIER
jgi:peptidase M1-like protein